VAFRQELTGLRRQQNRPALTVAVLLQVAVVTEAVHRTQVDQEVPFLLLHQEAQVQVHHIHQVAAVEEDDNLIVGSPNFIYKQKTQWHITNAIYLLLKTKP